MAERHFVVIGNGPAGNQAALTLRDKVPDARITLISRHRGGCYRPHLLPRLVAGEIEEEMIYVFSPSSYKDKGIKLRSGQKVVDINLERREIVLDHKEVLRFHGLIIAVGGTPRIPERLSRFRECMLTLKTLKDAKVWAEKLPGAETVLMIGGDLTSFAFAKTLLGMGKKVAFAINEDAFWPLRFSDELFEEVAHKLSQRDVQVIKHSRLDDLISVADGSFEAQMGEEKIRVGLVGAFFGLVPDIGFAARSGLRLDRGILVDQYLNTGFEGVYATGDCAQVYHPEIRDYWVSIGHDNAVSLGRAAALNLAGEKTRVDFSKESIFEVQGVKVNTSWWTEF
jgi:nitrite reductase (NADH) large subunit